jgi:hypothetical protein
MTANDRNSPYLPKPLRCNYSSHTLNNKCAKHEKIFKIPLCGMRLTLHKAAATSGQQTNVLRDQQSGVLYPASL